MKKTYLIDIKSTDSPYNNNSKWMYRLENVTEEYKNGFVEAIKSENNTSVIVSEIK